MPLKPKYIMIAVLVYLITAFFSLGHLHPDEYYQILEFAAYKLQLNSEHGLTWEFYAQIRSAFQAWVVVCLYKLSSLIHTPNPFWVAFMTRVLSGVLSLAAVILFIDTFKTQLKGIDEPHSWHKLNHRQPQSQQTPRGQTLQKWFIRLSLFSWLAIFNGIRYSSENISAKLFLIGLCLLFWPKFRRTWAGYIFIGFVLGLSFVCRYQVGLMLTGLLSWLLIINRLKFAAWAMLLSGIILAIAMGVYLDHWFYGDWVFTPWRYFAANIIQGKAATFSMDPWYMYLAIAGLIPYGPLYILAGLYFMYRRRTHVLTWIMLPFIAIHLLIGHKELRFLTPLLSFMPFIILDCVQLLAAKRWQLSPNLLRLNQIAWRFNWLVVGVVMFVPAAMQIRINELVYNRYQQATAFNYLTEGGNILDFYKHLNLRPVPISSPTQVDCHATENCVIALTCQETLKYGAPRGNLIFSDCPSWIFKLDFNNWLERTALYNIYELRSVEVH